MSDNITLTRLKVPIHIGVPDEERATAQDVEISVELTPERSLFKTEDDIQNTVNYYEVSQDITRLAQARPRRLIEQLNEEILIFLLKNYPLKHVTVTTYKYIIPETKHVSIKMSLSKEGLA